MNLAILFPGCHRRGGVERLVWEFSRNVGLRHRVTVFAAEWEACGAPNVAYRRVPLPDRPASLRPLFFAQRVRRALHGTTFDAVIGAGAECLPADVLWVSSVHCAWLERGRMVRNGLKSSPLRRFLPQHAVILALERRYYRRGRYRKAVTISDRVAEDLGRYYGVPRADTVTIPNGYAPDEFSPERRAALRAEARAELCLPDESVVLLMVANELHRKGFGTLLEAVARLADPRVRILLVGKADPIGYQGQIARLGLTAQVRWAGPTAEVARYHAAADLFALPTQYEAFCLAILEALGSGLPVVTTSVPGAGDVIRPGVNGLIQHDPLDADELACLLRQGLDADARAAWSAAAPETVRDYRWPNLLARFETALEELCRH